jgi:uncharacterized protein (DUF2236 family)
MVGAPEPEARRVAQGLRAIHGQVRGELREAAGADATGSPYAGTDPDLLLWVYAATVDALLRSYAHFARPLTPGERDRCCAEATRMGLLLGIPAAMLPGDATSLRSYMDAMAAERRLAATPAARAVARQVTETPYPGVGRTRTRLLRLATVGLLPPEVRGWYGLEWGPRDAAILAGTAAAVRRVGATPLMRLGLPSTDRC